MHIGRSGVGAPVVGRTDVEQPCGSQYHETLRAAELCAKAVSEGQECRWGGMTENRGGRVHAQGATRAKPQTDGLVASHDEARPGELEIAGLCGRVDAWTRTGHEAESKGGWDEGGQRS